ncbi:MAG: hypothetical protein CM15mP128_2430 [Methanobacteriota archaeon]|nr:MAG: hypothetical protein CM15mP128_2430 [Euryarchaeota archaeon]
MDGNFVPNLTFGPPVIRSLRAALGDGPTFYAHLMVSNAETCFQDYIDAGAITSACTWKRSRTCTACFTPFETQGPVLALCSTRPRRSRQPWRSSKT